MSEVLTYDEYLSKALAFGAAVRKENIVGKPYYVVHTKIDRWVVVDKMPLCGEWYTSDEVRHGQ